MNIAIIYTGIIENYFLDEFILYNKINNISCCKIISTWNYTDKLIIDKLKENNFDIVLNDFPEDIYKSSVNYQLYSFEKGVQYAKTKNITHVLRLRSDMVINNINEFLNIYIKIYSNKPIFLGMFNHDCGYLFDYVYLLSIEFFDSINFIYQPNYDTRFPEKYMQDLYFCKSNNSDILKQITSSILILVENNIKIIFLKQQHKDKTELLLHFINIGILE